MKMRPYSYITLKALGLVVAMLLIELIGRQILKMSGSESPQSIAELKLGCFLFFGLGGIVMGARGISQSKKKEHETRRSEIAEWIFVIVLAVSTLLYVLYHYLHARFGIW